MLPAMIMMLAQRNPVPQPLVASTHLLVAMMITTVQSILAVLFLDANTPLFAVMIIMLVLLTLVILSTDATILRSIVLQDRITCVLTGGVVK
jgi:hypothetical protein